MYYYSSRRGHTEYWRDWSSVVCSSDLLLSDVDGLYDGHPAVPTSRLLPDVHGEADLEGLDLGRPGSSGVGTGGMQTKVEAARIATGAGIPVVLTSAARAGAALAGEQGGTVFHPTGRRSEERRVGKECRSRWSPY